MDLTELTDSGGSGKEIDACAIHSHIVDDNDLYWEWMHGRPRMLDNEKVIGTASTDEDGSKVVIVEDEDTGIVEYRKVPKGYDNHLGAVGE